MQFVREIDGVGAEAVELRTHLEQCRASWLRSQLYDSKTYTPARARAQNAPRKCTLARTATHMHADARTHTSDSKFVDEDLRRSSYRAITDDTELFNLCDNIVKVISDSDPSFSYRLVRNDGRDRLE